MQEVLLAGAGGFIGAALRFGVGTWVSRIGAGTIFPWGTFAVNAVGCLAAGLLMAWATRSGLLTAPLRVLLFTGLLGGFTTLSAFGLETIQLLQRQEVAMAIVYVLGSVGAALAAVWIGLAAAR